MKPTTCFAPAHILLPSEQVPLEQWGCIACDQFTSDRSYWQRAEKTAAGAPSTLNLILPEVYLEDGDADARVEKIHATMQDYAKNVLTRAVDGFIYMSEQVHRELRRYTQVPALFSPHPLFENFGIVIDRTEACIRLELDPSKRYALFFGLIRDYKGLDLLLDAWKIYKREHPAEDRRLIVAGEFYAPKEKYLKQIADNGLEDDVILHDYFIPDELVRYYFSVADFLVQPYRSATQSGVTQIAYQFDLPMVVTDVGGLPEIVPDGRVGFVCRPDAAEVARAIDRIWRDDVLAGFRANMEEEKKRFSWDAMCDRITELYRLVK